ncbi:MAG: hypothetical protein MAG451_02758 [Anaerolineales bacterium]|nr:hypothetical protein [Anaerolineales bacterium]
MTGTSERANRQLMRIAAGAEGKDPRIAAIWSLGQLGLQESFMLLVHHGENPSAVYARQGSSDPGLAQRKPAMKRQETARQTGI